MLPEFPTVESDGHSVDCTAPSGHVVFDQMTPVRLALVRLALVRLALLRLAPVRFAFVSATLVKSQPCRSTPGPRAEQSTGATVVVVVVIVVVVVVVVVGTGAGVHAASKATHAANRTTRTEPCFRMIEVPRPEMAEICNTHKVTEF